MAMLESVDMCEKCAVERKEIHGLIASSLSCIHIC
jgi:hypothetical protein